MTRKYKILNHGYSPLFDRVLKKDLFDIQRVSVRYPGSRCDFNRTWSNSNLYGTESVTFVKQRPRQAPMTCQPTAPRRHLIDMDVRMPAFNST